jgi:hypothetical protein
MAKLSECENRLFSFTAGAGCAAASTRPRLDQNDPKPFLVAVSLGLARACQPGRGNLSRSAFETRAIGFRRSSGDRPADARLRAICGSRAKGRRVKDASPADREPLAARSLSYSPLIPYWRRGHSGAESELGATISRQNDRGRTDRLPIAPW